MLPPATETTGRPFPLYMGTLRAIRYLRTSKKADKTMARIFLGIIVFCIVAYTIGYFKVRYQKPDPAGGTPRTPWQEGSRILVLMLGIALLVFALFAVYQFGVYLFGEN